MSRTILVTGATGATGKLLVKELLAKDLQVRAMVRSRERLPDQIKTHEHVQVIEAAILDLSAQELNQYVKDCDAMACCLGHNLTWKGVFGHPRRLVTESVRRLCEAIKSNQQHSKLVLLNTAGNRNRDLKEPVSLSHKMVIGLIRLLLPPHVDNEKAADYLRINVGQRDDMIEWVAVRPDALIDQKEVTDYEVHPSPTRDPLFKSGETSRINVAHFMAALISDDDLWQQWKGQMPVIYNKGLVKE